MSNYRKTMADALLEMYPLTEETQLDEGTIDKVKEIASKKQAMKIDGVMVDSFTASAISQIYDKVNDNIKKKMDSLPITKLANLAMKMMQKNDYVPEEVDLDEGTKQVLAHGGKGKYKVTKDGDKIEIKFGGKVVGTADFDRGADSFFVSMKGEKGQKSFDDAQAIADYFAKNKITEEVDLDEKIIKHTFGVEFQIDAPDEKPISTGKEPHVKIINKFVKKHNLFDDHADDLSKFNVKDDVGGKKVMKFFKDIEKAGLDVIKKKITDNSKLTSIGEDLDEGKMSQLHQYIKDKKSPEEIAKMMKLDVKTVKSLMSSHHPEEVEESAASDARRAMKRDKDFSRRDTADDDTGATDDDVKGASKNIMMQMRKAQSLKGRFDVEFGDGKKVKVPAKMAIVVQQKYNAMRKPADKEKFQAKIGKSYKDMLSALKEELQPKKESILERMNRKIKENKDG
jgi:hypothetical protein